MSEKVKGICGCREMDLALEGEASYISYKPMFREYGINISPCLRDIIRYCPWCSSPLPSSLAETWAKILDARFGRDFNGVADERLPEEFKTDQWWRERGL